MGDEMRGRWEGVGGDEHGNVVPRCKLSLPPDFDVVRTRKLSFFLVLIHSDDH